MLIKAPKVTGTLGVTRTADTALACSNHRTGVRYFAVPVVNPIHLEIPSPKRDQASAVAK